MYRLLLAIVAVAVLAWLNTSASTPPAPSKDSRSPRLSPGDWLDLEPVVNSGVLLWGGRAGSKPGRRSDAPAAVREAAAMAVRAEEVGASDLSGVLVACDPCGGPKGSNECAAAAMAAARLLQHVLAHRVEMLLLREKLPSNRTTDLMTCAHKFNVDPAVNFDKGRLMVRQVSVERQRQGGLANWTYDASLFPEEPYMVFFQVGDARPFVRAHGYLSFMHVPKSARSPPGAGYGPALRTYDHVLVAREAQVEGYRALSLPGDCGTAVHLLPHYGGRFEGMAKGETWEDLYLEPMAELLSMYDLDFQHTAYGEKWQLWERMARDLHARRMAMCRTHVAANAGARDVVVVADGERDVGLPIKAKQLLATLGEGWGLVLVHTERTRSFYEGVAAELPGSSLVSYERVADLARAEVASRAGGADVSGVEPGTEAERHVVWKTVAFWSSLGQGVRRVMTYSRAVFLTGVPLPPPLLGYKWAGALLCDDGTDQRFLEPAERVKVKGKGAAGPGAESRALEPSLRVGGTGLSLRDVPTMVEVVRQHAGDAPLAEAEDVFYALGLHTAGRYGAAAPPLRQAERLGIEAFCPDLAATGGWANRTEVRDLNMRQFVPFSLHRPLASLEDYCVRAARHGNHIIELFDDLIMDAYQRPPPEGSTARRLLGRGLALLR